MNGGKADAPSAPTAEYTPLYTADSAAGNLAGSIGQNQLAYEQQQVGAQSPYTQEMMGGEQQIAAQGETNATGLASTGNSALGTFTGTTLPLAQQYSTQAANYNSPAQADLNAGLAVGDVANAASAANANTTQQLEGYGIDPSTTRFQALDLGANISTAAQEAGAATTSRVNTQQTGLGLENSAIGLGSTIGGLGTNALSGSTSALAGASGAGSTGVSEGLNQISTGASAIGTAPQYLGLAAQDYAGSSNIINNAYSNEAQTAQINNQNSANFMSGVGSLVGGAALLYATGGLSGIGSALGGVGSSLGLTSSIPSTEAVLNYGQPTYFGGK